MAEAAPLRAPEMLDVDEFSLTITWKDLTLPEGAVKARVEYFSCVKTDGWDAAEAKETSAEQEGGQFVLDELDPATPYRLRVRFLDAQGTDIGCTDDTVMDTAPINCTPEPKCKCVVS